MKSMYGREGSVYQVKTRVGAFGVLFWLFSGRKLLVSLCLLSLVHRGANVPPRAHLASYCQVDCVLLSAAVQIELYCSVFIESDVLNHIACMKGRRSQQRSTGIQKIA
jgi:hypothetical protein